MDSNLQVSRERTSFAYWLQPIERHISPQLTITRAAHALHELKMTKMRNLNDADIISMPMFTTCKLKMGRIILFMRNRKSAFVFSAASSQPSSVRISYGSENFDFRR